MDPVAVNDLCESPDFVRRVMDRAGGVSLWELVFRGAAEAPAADVMGVFSDPGVFEGADDAQDSGDPPALASARELHRIVSGKAALPEGIGPEALFGAALDAPAEGVPDHALRLRLLAFLRLVAIGLPPDPRAASALIGGLLAFPEREGTAPLLARALATAAVTLQNLGSGGAREADRFLTRLLALKGMANFPDLTQAFVALSLRLVRPEPPSWGPRPGFGAFGGALRTVTGLVRQLPDETLADLPLAACLSDPALKGLSLVELLKIKERLSILPRSGEFRALRLSCGVLEASLHMRDGGEAASVPALAVIQDLDEDGVLDCLKMAGPGAPDPARLETLASRLGRAFARAREEEMAGLFLTLGTRRDGAANTGFWSSLPFSLALPFAAVHPGGLEGVFLQISRGRLLGGDALALFRFLVSSVFARDCSRPPVLSYAHALRCLEERAGDPGAGETVRGRAALAAATELARAAAGPDAARPEGGDGGDEVRPWDPELPFRRLAELHSDPEGPFRGGEGAEGLLFTAWAAALVASASEERLWPAVSPAAGLCPAELLSEPVFTERFLAPAFHDIILRTQKADLHGAVRPALRAAMSLPRTPELAGAASALLRLEIFKSVADETAPDPELEDFFRDLMASRADPGFRADLLDSMLVRLGVSGKMEDMERLLMDSAAEAMTAWEAFAKAAAAIFPELGAVGPVPQGGADSGPASASALPGSGDGPASASPCSGDGTASAGIGDGPAVAETGAVTADSGGVVAGTIAGAEAGTAGTDFQAGGGGASGPAGQAPGVLPDQLPGGPGERAAAIAAYFMAEARDFRKAATLLFAVFASPGLLPAKRATAEAVIAGLAAQGAFEEATAVCDAFAAFADSEGDPASADGARMILGEGMRGGPAG
ncbi:MAG: hypothetical protein LBT40_08875 [Deltaproteobacteria bacterium]|jgi:hypothetical protein|nr:hypothetical protein [Deltaproteobacteria bacterium]